MVEIVEAAISLRLPVFPCGEGKRPTCRHGFKDAAVEMASIYALWQRSPGPLIGVPTGRASGFVALDIDPQGLTWLYPKVQKRRLPQTRVHRTPRGGFHFLYLCPDPPIANSTSKIAIGVDTRGEGGYVIYPPSPGYTIVDDSPYAPFPRWLQRILEKHDVPDIRPASLPGDATALERFVAAARPGERNNRLFWAACRLGELRLEGNARDIAAAAERTGLSSTEIHVTIASGLRRGMLDGANRRS